MVLSPWHARACVHSVRVINAEQRQTVVDLCSKPTGDRDICWPSVHKKLAIKFNEHVYFAQGRHKVKTTNIQVKLQI